jgi:hypothetical protein
VIDSMKLAVWFAVLFALARVTHAATDPRRKVVVLEYRAGSAALPGIADRITRTLAHETSLAVLGPDQVRALYGDHLAQAIVRCSGDPACIARIGQRAGAAEVILVGVSELGDVILTMQRIDVRAGTVSARIADSMPNRASPSDAQLDGYLTRLLPPADFLRFGTIDIIANQAGAIVTVGGHKRGTTPLRALKLHAPATYVIRIEKEGYSAFTTTVQLPPDGALKVDAELSRKGTTAWYQHWYVIAAAGLIAAGAAGTTIYYTTQHTSDRVPVTGTVQ